MTELENRLENWGFVMGRTRAGAGRCGSAEGNYTPERGVYTLEERRVPRTISDPKDAALVEAAWARMVNRKAKNLLRLHFVRRCPWDFIARRQGIPMDKDAFDGHLRIAMRDIGCYLDAPQYVAG